jgi:hypothetical protein
MPDDLIKLQLGDRLWISENTQATVLDISPSDVVSGEA